MCLCVCVCACVCTAHTHPSARCRADPLATPSPVGPAAAPGSHALGAPPGTSGSGPLRERRGGSVGRAPDSGAKDPGSIPVWVDE